MVEMYNYEFYIREKETNARTTRYRVLEKANSSQRKESGIVPRAIDTTSATILRICVTTITTNATNRGKKHHFLCLLLKAEKRTFAGVRACASAHSRGVHARMHAYAPHTTNARNSLQFTA